MLKHKCLMRGYPSFPGHQKTCLCKVLIRIDYSTPKLHAVKISTGQPEERQELLPGPDAVAVCTWANGSTYKTDIPNLQLESRAAATVKTKKAKGKAKAKGKGKAKGKPKGKGKAKAKPKAKAKAAAAPLGEEDSEEEGEEPPGAAAVVVPPAVSEDRYPTIYAMGHRSRYKLCTHLHINVIHCS